MVELLDRQPESTVIPNMLLNTKLRRVIRGIAVLSVAAFHHALHMGDAMAHP